MTALEFYPSRKSIRDAWLLGGFFALSTAGCATLIIEAIVYEPDWFNISIFAGFGLVSALFGYGILRSARRMSNGRRHHDPQLLIDRAGVVVFETFFWRRQCVEWREIGAIAAVETRKEGIEIIVMDNRGKYRPVIEFRTDELGPVDAINARFKSFADRLGRP